MRRSHAFAAWVLVVSTEFKLQFKFDILDYGGFELLGDFAFARFDQTLWGEFASDLAWKHRKILQDVGLGVDVLAGDGKDRLGLSNPIPEEKDASDLTDHKLTSEITDYLLRENPKFQELAREVVEEIKALTSAHNSSIEAIYQDFCAKATTIFE